MLWSTWRSWRLGGQLLPAQRHEIDRRAEESRHAVEEPLRAVFAPAAVLAVPQVFRFDLAARERLLRPAADVRLAFFEHPPVLERHADVPGVGFGIRIVGIHHVSHLGGEREYALVVNGLFGKRRQTGATRHEGYRDVERSAELRDVLVRRPVLGG